MERDKAERMLELLEERLSSYTTDETLERLSQYPVVGPTVEEFLDGVVDE